MWHIHMSWLIWWYTYPWKIWVRQLGWWFPIYGKIKNVPSHQPEYLWIPFAVLDPGSPIEVNLELKWLKIQFLLSMVKSQFLLGSSFLRPSRFASDKLWLYQATLSESRRKTSPRHNLYLGTWVAKKLILLKPVADFCRVVESRCPLWLAGWQTRLELCEAREAPGTVSLYL